MDKKLVKAQVYQEDSEGKLKILSFNKKRIYKDSEHEGRLNNGIPVVMSVVKNKEVWYYPYKYQKGM